MNRNLAWLGNLQTSKMVRKRYWKERELGPLLKCYYKKWSKKN